MEFHCPFHSDSLGDFIVNFICIPWRFQLIFRSCTLGISLSISYLFPGAFNGFFILVPWGFHCQFHIYSLALSIHFSFWYLGDFIVNFIFIPWHFQWIFHSCTLGISFSISYLFPATFNGIVHSCTGIFHCTKIHQRKDKLIIKNHLGYLEWNNQNIHMYLI